MWFHHNVAMASVRPYRECEMSGTLLLLGFSSLSQFQSRGLKRLLPPSTASPPPVFRPAPGDRIDASQLHLRRLFGSSFLPGHAGQARKSPANRRLRKVERHFRPATSGPHAPSSEFSLTAGVGGCMMLAEQTRRDLLNAKQPQSDATVRRVPAIARDGRDWGLAIAERGFEIRMTWAESMQSPRPWRPKKPTNQHNSFFQNELSAFIGVYLRFHLIILGSGDCRVAALLAMTGAGKIDVRRVDAAPNKPNHAICRGSPSGGALHIDGRKGRTKKKANRRSQRPRLGIGDCRLRIRGRGIRVGRVDRMPSKANPDVSGWVQSSLK
jgi:hypothetical protein